MLPLATNSIPLPARTAFAPRAFTGWALDASVECDQVCPGFLSFLLCASPLRRQGIFLALAELELTGPNGLATRLCPDERELCTNDPLAQIAHALKSSTVREIVAATLGDPTAPFVGTLNRIGDRPFDRSFYRHLFALFTEPQHRAKAKIFRQLPRLTPRVIGIVDVLDELLLAPNVVERLRTIEQAEDLNEVLTVIRSCTDTTDEALVMSLQNLKGDISSWVHRWLEKAARFPTSPPMPDDNDLVGLHSGNALRDAGRRYENCLREKVPLAVLGRSYFYEYRPAPTIIELTALTNGKWLFEGGLYAPKNAKADREVAWTIRHKLHEAGVLMPPRALEGSLSGLARLLGVYHFDSFGLAEAEEALEAAA